jgi:putative transposase
MLGGRGSLTRDAHWQMVIDLIGEANSAGAGLVSACREIGICLCILIPWRNALVVIGTGSGLIES